MKTFRPFVKLSIFLTGLIFFITSAVNATTYYSFGTPKSPNTLANWWTVNNGTGSHPAAFTTGTDIFIIQSGCVYTTSAAWTVAGSIQVLSGGTLATGGTNSWTMSIGGTTSVSGTLTLNNTATKTFTGDVTVNNGGLMTLPATSMLCQTHNLIVATGGTLAHNTTYDNGSTILEVLGNLDINGTYSYNSTPAVVMDAASGTFNINTSSTSLYSLFLKNSIYKCSGNLTVTNQFYAMWNLDLGEFHTNGFTVTATTWGLVNAGGTVFVDGGSLNVGGAVGGILSGHTGPTGANAHITITSGTLTTTGLYIGVINASPVFTFNSIVTQSGGTVNVNGPIVVDASTTASKYLMSGGTLNANGGLTMSSPALFTCSNSPVINVGGSWINTGTFTPATSTVTFNGTGSQTISNSSATSFNNLIINPSAGVTVNVASGNLSILSDLTVTTGTFDLSTLTCNRSVAGGTFSVASGAGVKLGGTTGGPTGSNFPNNFTTNTLNANSTVEYNAGGSQTVYATPTYGHLILSTGGTKTAANSLTIAGNLTINTTATFAGGTLFSHSVGGNWNNNVSTSAYTPSTSTVTFNGVSAQTIGGTAGTTFNNLTINNASGVSITQDQTVNSTLTLSAGNLTIGSNNLILGSSALPVVGTFSATRMIVADGTGEVRKNYSAVGSYLFPIGDVSGTAEYSPITLNLTAGSGFSSAYLGVSVTNSKHPNNASTLNFLKRYWKVNQSGITGCTVTATGTYLTADINGTEGLIKAAQLNGTFNQATNPWVKYSVLAANTLTALGATITAGQTSVFTGITAADPTVSISGGGVTVCNGTPVSLTATPVGDPTFTYLWSPSTGLSSTTVSNPTATPSSTQTYSVIATDGNGITSAAANTTITVNPTSVGGSVSGGAAVCSGTNSGTLTLSGQTGSVVRWEYSTDGGTTWSTIVNTTTTQILYQSYCRYFIQGSGAKRCVFFC